MTNHEAIETLKANYPDACFEQLREAVDTAIFALQRSTHKALDTISRQDAIDIAMQYCPDDDGSCSKGDRDIRELLDDLENLPSAQPERTCVNCGRTANNGGWYADGRTRCPIEEHYALPKDGYCHLWEKRNITDDDYPERRTDEPDK